MKLIKFILFNCFMALNALAMEEKSNPYNAFIAAEIVPYFFSNLESCLKRLIEIDSQRAHKKHSDEKIEKLEEALLPMVAHFQYLALQPQPYQRAKLTKLARRMVMAWNAEQEGLLLKIFNEFDSEEGSLFPAKAIHNEQALRELLKRLFFHCALVLDDVAILLKQSTSDQEVMKEAIISYLLQESSNELSAVSHVQLQGLKKILTTQVTMNQEKLWGGWRHIEHTLKHMIIRKPNNHQEHLYEEMMKRLGTLHKQKKKDISIDNLKEDHYQLVHCTLGRPATWELKNTELKHGFSLVKKGLSLLAHFFKGTIAGLIKKGFKNEQFIGEDDDSLDEAFKSFVDAILDPALHIFMKQNNMDDLVNVLLPKVKSLLLQLHESTDDQPLLDILKQFKTGMDKIILEDMKN